MSEPLEKIDFNDLSTNYILLQKDAYWLAEWINMAIDRINELDQIVERQRCILKRLQEEGPTKR